jgi:hypothetical protein
LGQSELAPVLETYTGPPEDPANLSTDSSSQVLDLEQYETFLRLHVEKTKVAMEERRPDIERMQESFLTRLTAAIKANEIPITLEEAKRRMDNAKIAFLDPDYGVSGGGHFDYEARKTVVNPFLPDEKLQRTIDHEFMHAISGRTVKIGSLTSNGQPDIFFREGVATEFTNEDGYKFDWLNEAVTERLAMQIRDETETSDNKTYAVDRKILELLTKRVALPAFYKAHFEDFDPATSTPANTVLMATLDEQFEPRILYTLDTIIKREESIEDGLRNAIAYLEALESK